MFECEIAKGASRLRKGAFAVSGSSPSLGDVATDVSALLRTQYACVGAFRFRG